MKRSQAEALLLKYCYVVLENRWRYYVGRYYKDVECISDEKYDKIEADYEKLCRALGKEPYSTNMVSFTMERASCRMVHAKMCQKYNLDPQTTRPVG